MAVLNKIRQRSVFIIIIAMALFAFVLSDIIRNGGFSSDKTQDTVAVVNGRDIPRQEFMEQVEAAQRSLGPNGSNVQAMNMVYDSELRRVLYEEQLETLGMEVGEKHLNNALSFALANNPTFQNEAGLYDQGKVNEYVATIKSTSPQMYQQWQDFIKSTKQGILQNTYNTMVQAGMVATATDAEREYRFENDRVNFQYVHIPYTTIPDADIAVSEEEIKAYIQEHPNDFEVEPKADIEYVLVREDPSDTDVEAFRDQMEGLVNTKVEFNNVAKTNDTVQGFATVADHVAFVNNNSDQTYQDRWYFKQDMPEAIQDTLFNQAVGALYGPYKMGNTFRLSKIVAQRSMPDSVKARHILISWEGLQTGAGLTRTKEEAKTLADSINTAVNGQPSKFGPLAAKYSADNSNKDKGGDLGYFTPGAMVPKFNDFVFDNPQGTVGVVETRFGYHIVEIEDQKNPQRAVKVATVVKEVEPSEKTLNDVFAKATKFEVAAKDGDFKAIAEAQGLETRPVNKIGVLDANLPGIGDNRAIVNWAFNEETAVGDVKRFSIPNGYVIAHLTRKDPKGLLSVAEATPTVAPILRNGKKAEKIREGISGETLEAIAAQQGITVQDASAVTMASPTIPGAGNEPKVVGAAFGTKALGTPGLINGEKGVYKIMVLSRVDAPTLDNYESYKNQLNTKIGNAGTKILDALKNAAEIEDYRANFF
ncbi:MAG: peptidylprolyl isomerase [Marinirhabdus sp.]